MHDILIQMLHPVCLLLLFVFSIYSSDLEFHNLLLNCDMLCLFSSCLVYVVWYASGGRLEMSKSLPACPIWSGFLAHLPPFSCVGFTMTGLLGLWSDYATHRTVTVWGDGSPPISTSRYFTPTCWLGWALHLFWGQLCFYNTPKRSLRLSKKSTSTLGLLTVTLLF